MLAKRIIACLDIKNGRTVKGVNFENIRDAGDPVELGAFYAAAGIDELVFLDITATNEKRKTLADLAKKIAAVINIPFTVGGGVASIEDVRVLLQNGADKIAVNSAAFKNPELVAALAKEFGSQCIVVAIDTKQEASTVLNIVTTYAFTGSAYVVPSATAKAGVLAMTRSLAVEWAKYGIRTNAIAPGPFPTKGAWDRLLPGDLKEKFDLSKKVPLKRVGDHQELANLAAYLVSDFSAYINGEVIVIDGGEWLKGAGQFNLLEAVPEEMWDMLEMMIKAKKNS